MAQRLGLIQIEKEVDRGLLYRCITRAVLAHDASRAGVIYLALRKTVDQVFLRSWEHYCQLAYNPEQILNFIKFIGERFHTVVEQFSPQNLPLEFTDEYYLKKLLQLIPQIRYDIDILHTRVIEVVNKKSSTQIINNQGLMISGENIMMSNNQNHNIEVQQNFKASVYGVAGKVEGNQNIFVSEQRQTLAEAAQEIQQLLQQLEASNPTATEIQKAEFVKMAIAPTRKERFLSALNAGWKEAIKEFLDNSYINVAIAILEGWKNAEG